MGGSVQYKSLHAAEDNAEGLKVSGTRQRPNGGAGRGEGDRRRTRGKGKAKKPVEHAGNGRVEVSVQAGIQQS